MKVICLLLIGFFIGAYSEVLFEVKDSANHTVLEVTNEGLTVFDTGAKSKALGDTLMTISSKSIKAFISNSKALSRTFAVTTTSSKEGSKAQFNAFEVGTSSAIMKEGTEGVQYTNFSPNNIFLGLNSGTSTVPGVPYDWAGKYNVFMGNSSGLSNISGGANVYIGVESGYFGQSCNNNTLVGASAGMHNASDNNVFIGNSSGSYSQTGKNNVFAGLKSGMSNKSGSYNVYLGADAGNGNNAYSHTGEGNNNVFIGDSCAFKTLQNDRNVFIGKKSGFSNQYGDGNIFLGNYSGYNETGSNRLYIDNSDISTPLIYGEFDNDIVRINGKLGVGTAPSYKIHSIDATTGLTDEPAVYGKHNATTNYGIGVQGEGGYIGVHGQSIAANGYEVQGVRGDASGTGTGTRYGVYGSATGGSTAYGVYGKATGAAVNWAGYFEGNVEVTGTITKSADEIISDHPIDPENKYLTHSSVASSEMKNLYDGVVTLDEDGMASVTLPEWFEAYNSNFRYQMTAIGKPCPNIHISKKISKGKFEIAGGEPGAEVCWMVTGTRNDNYAKTNPMQAETDKFGDEKGLYLNPEAFGLPEEKGLRFIRKEDAARDKR